LKERSAATFGGCFHHATTADYTGFVLGKTYDSEVCSAARALELVGERWSLLIIRDALFAGATRYSDFRSLDIATNILKTRLDGFIESGIMERRASERNPDHFEYVLTEKGRDLATVVVALTEWGDRWLAPDGPPGLYTHSLCGGQLSLVTNCTNCGQVLDPSEICVRPGPGNPTS
jgi:DNA-binding HxlR family transcriptional regulator